MLNEIKLQKCRHCDPTHIRHLDHIKRWKVLEVNDGGADRMWISLIQQHCAPRNGQNSTLNPNKNYSQGYQSILTIPSHFPHLGKLSTCSFLTLPLPETAGKYISCSKQFSHGSKRKWKISSWSGQPPNPPKDPTDWQTQNIGDTVNIDTNNCPLWHGNLQF